MATIGCGLSHKDKKHTDKCSNKKQKQHRNNTTKPQKKPLHSKYNTKKTDIKYTHIM